MLSSCLVLKALAVKSMFEACFNYLQFQSRRNMSLSTSSEQKKQNFFIMSWHLYLFLIPNLNTCNRVGFFSLSYFNHDWKRLKPDVTA